MVEARGLGKKYARDQRLGARYATADIAAELAPWRWRSEVLRSGEFWAIDDVDLSIEAGDSVAFLGPNGAGKSTLLMLLAGLVKPDRGMVRTRGRVNALLELGAGFDDTLTGRENARLGAAINGLRGRAAREAVDAAMTFVDIGAAVDAPLRSYSSGMRARLAYAVAASLDPDVLLVDEVLAVGDLDFQRRCLDHMANFRSQGGTLLFVSHNFFLVQSTCERGIVLDRGRVRFDGSVVDAVGEMLRAGPREPWAPDRRPTAAVPLTIDAVRVDNHGDAVVSGGSVDIELDVVPSQGLDVRWCFSIWSAHGSVCITGAWAPQPQRIVGPTTLRCTIPRLPLLAGRYDIRLGVIDECTNHPLAAVGFDDPAVQLYVEAPPDRFVNQQLSMGQLTHVDVDWS
jgi:lipopolysaccharide transport system ATP-binding protein